MDEQAQLDLRGLIQNYFRKDFENAVIIDFLARYHGVEISISTLKRRLQDYGLRRRRRAGDGDESRENQDRLRDIISHEMSEAGELRGYRSIWHSLRLEHGINVPRALVAEIMRDIDPVGVQLRKRRKLKRRRYVNSGPNYCWHVDGNISYS